MSVTDPLPPRREVTLRGGPFDGETARVRVEGPTLRISMQQGRGNWHRYAATDDPDIYAYEGQP